MQSVARLVVNMKMTEPQKIYNDRHVAPEIAGAG
jgi:hypothetical protein